MTSKLSDTKYVIANKYFTEIYEIQEELSHLVDESVEHTSLGAVTKRE